MATICGPATGASIDELIARGDEAWEVRAQGHRQSRAAPLKIGEAIAAYEQALQADPDNQEARWKLMRALFFQGEHVLGSRESRLRVFERGRALGEDGIDQVAAEAGTTRQNLLEMPSSAARKLISDPSLAAETFFWSAVHSGLWGQVRGKIAAARQGVAGRIRDYASMAVALDSTVEHGGGHRILGRLHTEAPRIPFVTGWVDRQFAVAELELCRSIFPDDLTTQYYLGEALIEFVPERRVEGIEMLRQVVASEPDPRWVVEELKAISDAAAVLERVDS